MKKHSETWYLNIYEKSNGKYYCPAVHYAKETAERDAVAGAVVVAHPVEVHIPKKEEESLPVSPMERLEEDIVLPESCFAEDYW